MELQFKFESDNFKIIKKVIKCLNIDTDLDWKHISENIAGDPDDVCFSKFLSKYDNYIDFDKLSSNTKINWTSDFIDNYSHRLDLGILSVNTTVPFTEELILTYENMWRWKGDVESSHKYAWHELGGLSYNPRFPIDKNLIAQVADKIDFRALGMNSSLIIFDPNSVYDEYWPCELGLLSKNITVVMEFWDRWSFEGSTWRDGNHGTSGTKRDSISDNKNIDWKLVNTIRPYYKSFIRSWEHSKPSVFDDDNNLPF
jgi:hypothetical protein